MKLLRIMGSNFKVLKLVELEFDPEGGLVVISGKNGAGKTCTMDIVSACLGGKKLCPEKPIREGQKFAEIEVETDDWTVTRRFVEGGTSTLKVVRADGCIVPKGQTFLDTVIGKIGFDPLQFVNEPDAKKQRKTLLDLVGVDLTELDGKIKALREQRTAVGRTLKQAEAEVEASDVFPDAPDAEISVGDMLQEIEIAHAVNRAIDSAENHIEQLNIRIAELSENIAQCNGMVAEEMDYISKHQRIESNAIRAQIQSAEETNRQVRANAENKKIVAHALAVSKAHHELAQGIKAAEADKQSVLNLAEMPVAGLSVDEDGVTFNGIPIAQIAESEKIKVGLAVSMALNPTLTVLLIRDGSLLDKDNMALIEEMVKEKGFQALVERVDDGSGEVGFYIEEGKLKE